MRINFNTLYALSTSVKVDNYDHKSGRVLLRDTKNRTDHLLLLSREALAIAEDACKGREPDESLFPIVDARKTLAWINKQAGTTVQGHGLRSTFTSIAEELVSGGVLKRIINHAVNNDVTLGHYVGKRRNVHSRLMHSKGWPLIESQKFCLLSPNLRDGGVF